MLAQPFPPFLNFTNQPLLLHTLIVLQTVTPGALASSPRSLVDGAWKNLKSRRSYVWKNGKNDLWQPFNPDSSYEED